MNAISTTSGAICQQKTIGNRKPLARRSQIFSLIFALCLLFGPLAMNAQTKALNRGTIGTQLEMKASTNGAPQTTPIFPIGTQLEMKSSPNVMPSNTLLSKIEPAREAALEEINSRGVRATGDYELVTASQTDWSGEYVIAYHGSRSSATVMTGRAGSGTNTYGTGTSFTVTNNILASTDVANYKVTIAKDGNYYTIKWGSYYLGAKNGNNLLFSTTTPTQNTYRWTISYSGSTLSIANANYTTRLIKWNSGGNGQRFACYTSAQNDISLFKKIESSCAKPEGLAVDEESVTAHAATVTWTAGNATLWNLRYKKVDASTWTTVNGLTSAPYTFSNLDDGDAYEVQVQADCGNEPSEWTTSVYIYTDCEVKSLPFFCGFESLDEWGCFSFADISDYTDIQTSNIRTGSYCLMFSSNSNVQYLISPEFDGTSAIALSFWYRSRNANSAQAFMVGYATESNFSDLTFGDVMTAQSNTYSEYTDEFPKGTKYVVLAYYAENSSFYVDDFNFTVATGCIAPYALTASDITKNSATISWNQGNNETQWQICLNGNESNPTLVSTDSYTFTGLTPETTYTVKVRAYCDATHQSDWSEEFTFTTEAACPVPENLTAGNITNTSANISWDRYDEVELEYAEVTGTIATINGSWLQYDDGTLAINLGASTSYDWTWASMYPASLLNGKTVLTKVSIYESSYNTEDITIDIYSGGTSSPGTKIYTETVTTQHSDAFHEIEFASPVTIDPSQNLWIVLTTYGTYVMPMCSSTETNNQWVENEGWYNVADLGDFGSYGWMIRGYIEEIDYSSLNWYPLGTQSTPYELTGLSPETQYIVRARANCGAEDGYSQWATTTFTTLDNCADPYNLTASDITGNSATLNWSGAQERYNVSYKKVYFFEDFEDGVMPDGWTTINNGSDSYNWYYDNTNSHAHSGSGVMSSASSVSSGNGWNDFTPDHWLITPLIDLQGTMSVWVRSQQSNESYYQEHFTIYVSTTGTAVSDFSVLVPENVTTIEYVEYTADLSSYAGQQGYIAIRHHNCNGQFRMNIDDFGIYGAEQTASATENSVTINGLDPSTEYMWQVQGVNCDGVGGNTQWSDYAFFTTMNAHTLTTTVNPASSGTITCSPASANGLYTEGQSVQLTATAEPGYTFSGWTVDGASAGSTNPYSITMNADHNVVANFTLNSYTIAVSANPAEGGTVGGGDTYNHFSSCTVTAAPKTDYCFKNWTENGEVVSTSASYTFTVSGPRTLVANFTHYLEVSNIAAVDYCVDGAHAAVSAAPTAGSGAYTYTWQMNNGSWVAATGAANTSTYNPPYSTTGTVSYRVSVVDNNGCADHNSVVKEFNVKVSDAPSITLSAPPVCSGNALTLEPTVNNNGKDITSSSYQISENNSDWSSFTNGSAVTDEKDGYYIRYNASNTCGDASETVQITVNSLPAASITGPDAVCPGSTATLTTSGSGVTFSWNDGAGEGSSWETPAITANTEFTLVVTNTSTNCTSQATKSVAMTVPTASERSAMGVTNGCYIWTGNDENWNGGNNWMKYSTSGGGTYTITTTPSSKNVVIGEYGTCVSESQTLTLNANSSVKAIRIASGITVSGSKTLSVSGDMVNNGTFDASVTFKGTTTLSGSGATNFRNVTINAEKSFTSGSSDITVKNKWTNNGTYTAGDGQIVFGGSSAQTITGTSETTFKNIKINNSKGIKIETEPTINGALTFTSGKITGNITFASTGTSTGASTSRYVDGTVTKYGNGSSFTFPTGSDKVLGTITATIASGENATAKFNHKSSGFDQENDGYPRWWNVADMCGTDPFNHISNLEYWDFSSSADLSDVKFVSKASSAAAHFHDPSEYPQPEDGNIIQIAVYDGCWKNSGGTLEVSADHKTITISGVGATRRTRGGGITSFGSKSKDIVLPIELLSFTATCNGKYAELAWSTASERNNDYFVIERSADAIEFTEVGRVAGAGNSIEQLDYTFNDYGIHGGDNYYRLVQVDYDGTRSVSEIVVANCVDAVDEEPEVMAYPNPFNGELTIVLDNFDNRPATIEVYDMLGKQVLFQKADAPQNSYETILNLSNLPTGAYNVRVSTADFVINRQVVKN